MLWINKRRKNIEDLEHDLKLRQLKTEYDKKHFDAELELARTKAQHFSELHAVYLRGAKETQVFEHEFHSSREEKRVELAKLDALIEAKKELLDALLSEKDSQITLLTNLLNKLLPEVKKTK